MDYFLHRNTNPSDKNYRSSNALVRVDKGKIAERYDIPSGKWIQDPELARAMTGIGGDGHGWSPAGDKWKKFIEDHPPEVLRKLARDRRRELGGAGSGFYGHRGRDAENKQGGSLPRGASAPEAVQRAISRTFSNSISGGGITIKAVEGFDEPKVGYVVAAHEERGVVIENARKMKRSELAARIEAYRSKHIDLLGQDGVYFGTWLNKETGNLHLDISVVVLDKAQAIKLGIEHDQIAIWDIVNKREIPTGGSGKKGDQG